MKKNKNYIDKKDPTPLYFQLQEIITHKVKNKEFLPNDFVPTEKELVEEYNLSRTTVRQAINNLVSQGVLERKRGLGTIVSGDQKHIWNLQRLKSFSEEFESRGHEVKTRVLSMDIISKNSSLVSIFGDEVNQYYKLERLRYIDYIPSILVTTYIPFYLAPNLSEYDFSSLSLFKVLNEVFDVEINSAEKDFNATIVTEQDKEMLNITSKSPIQLVKTITYDVHNKPIEYSISRDRGDLSVYKVILNYEV